MPKFASDSTLKCVMEKIKVGIIFGGNSREREISFAGGRTVYDNLNKSVFDPIPLLLDSFGNFVLLNWEYIYKGSIRDFYPPVDFLVHSPNEFQVYAESLNLKSSEEQRSLTQALGKSIAVEELTQLIDFAFLCLHGTNGEDGRVQGMLEYLKIPYSGSGIMASAFGMNKVAQKQLMSDAKFNCPNYFSIKRDVWKNGIEKKLLFDSIKTKVGFPCVVKAANQGSSIGISVVQSFDENELAGAIDKAFFIHRLDKKNWSLLSRQQQVDFVRSVSDIREGVGLPLLAYSENSAKEKIYHPEALISLIEKHFLNESSNLILEGCDSENEVLIEHFIEGKEFSCIVIRNVNGQAVALPPTEIRKGKEVFDYRSKYLPGLSRKITPIDLPYENIQKIRKECERLFNSFFFNVYARIDGFITTGGEVFLNDPNTTSGMMPSSFFFHQAAEIGLNPSQFLSYIIRTSILERMNDFKYIGKLELLLKNLDAQVQELKKGESKKIAVAVILGGYSSERHISVESGRNIYEKLSSSNKYEPIPVFLTGDENNYKLFQIPVSLLLKDNADDIREKILHFNKHEVVSEIMNQCETITSVYTSTQNVLEPKELSFEQLSTLVDFAFIALHGRPGEDGALQKNLERVGLPYNGSGIQSSQLTINKFETNELLLKNGFHAAKHRLISKEEWSVDSSRTIENILKDFTFPFIAKPVDDGCSSAVKKIKSKEELISFADLIFRKDEVLPERSASVLQLKRNEEFPIKQQFLIEELIQKGDASHFLEITGGLLTHFNENGKQEFEIFEASETLSEGDVLSLEEKFLAGQGQNITPARYDKVPAIRNKISSLVRKELLKAAKLLNIEGYARIDAFVRIYNAEKIEVVFIEVNSLPGMTPATCIFHQTAINGYKPYDFIDKIIEYGLQKKKHIQKVN